MHSICTVYLPLFSRLEILESCECLQFQWIWYLNYLRWLHKIQFPRTEFSFRIYFNPDLDKLCSFIKLQQIRANRVHELRLCSTITDS